MPLLSSSALRGFFKVALLNGGSRPYLRLAGRALRSATSRPVARKALACVRKEAPRYLKWMKDERPGGKVAHRFWQRGGGYDRNLLRAPIVRQTIEYVHANPVRRGLVDAPEDWFWSSAGYYLDNRPVPLIPDADSIPSLDAVLR